jgi:acyl carrier protein
MGLDTVELVIRVEDTFGISISDSEAGKIFTVGQLHSCVMAKLGQAEKPGCLSSLAFYRARRAMTELWSVSRNKVRLETQLVELVPSDDRPSQWQQFGDSLGLRLPGLVRPFSVHTAIWFMTSILIVAPASGPGPTQKLPLYVSVAGGGLFVILAYQLTRPLTRQFPRHCTTVRELIEAILKLNFSRLAAEGGKWNEKEVWDTLRSIIVEELGVKPEEVKPGARFIEDLRAD